MLFAANDHADFPFWDPRRPWRLAAGVVLCLVAFFPVWFATIVLTLGVAGGKGAVVVAALFSTVGVIAVVLEWRKDRGRYPPEQRGSLRSFQGLICAIAVLLTLAAVALFGTWAWDIS